MRVIPAIDIFDGKVVRLTHGDPRYQTIYSDSPVAMAEEWASCGAEMIHVVDLDGAFEGCLKNFHIVKEILKKIKAKIELGGGIRNMDTVKKVLAIGVAKVVIGTRALDDKFLEEIPEELKDSIVVGIDVKKGMVYTKGWLVKTRTKAADLAKKIEDAGITTINYTDISTDGALEGPNVESLRKMLDAVKIGVVSSGGISNIDDVRKLKALEKDGLVGMIIGKALYAKALDLKEAIKVCSQKE